MMPELSQPIQIRIVALDRDARVEEGGPDASQCPVVGDEGTLVDRGIRDGQSTYIVQKVDPDLGTVWRGEFFIDEIEIIDPTADEVSPPKGASKQLGFLISIISIMGGNALAAVTCLTILRELSVGIVFFAATVSSLFGIYTATRFLDGLRLVVIVAITTWLVFLFFPIPLALRHLWLSGASGLCASRMILGGYRDFRDGL